MRILMLAFIGPDYPHILRKFGAQFAALRDKNPDTHCMVLNCHPARPAAGLPFTCLTGLDRPAMYAACANMAEDLRPDVIYFRYPLFDENTARFVERYPNVVFEHHTIEEKELPPDAARQEKLWAGEVFKNTLAVVGVTDEILRYEQARSPKPLPGIAIGNGVDFAASPLLPRPAFEQTLHIGMAAHFAPWHGVDRLLEGLRLFPRRDTVRLHLAGAGEALDEYKRLANAYGLRDNVIFHGELPPQKLREMMNACHLAAGSLAPSRVGLSELASLKNREYAFSGLPFFFAGGDPDFPPALPFVRVLPDDESPIDIAALWRFAEECAKAPEPGETMRAYAEQRLTWEAKSGALLDFLRQVAPPRAEAPARPFVSVIVPCYNHARFLPENIASLAAQDFADMEVIIVNDGSPDNTSEVARECMARWPELPIRLIEQENAGLSMARNAGIRAASGTWIVCLDSDDMLAEGFLKAAHAESLKNPHWSLINGQRRCFGAHTDEWKTPRYCEQSFPYDENPIPCTAMFRRDLWQDAGGYDPSHPWGIEDWHFWLKCRERGWVVGVIQAPMLHYRTHEQSSMYTTMMERWDEAVALHRTMLPDTYGSGEILAAHNTLLAVSEASLERIRKKAARFPDLPLPQLWLGLYHEGRAEADKALPHYLRAAACRDPGVAWQARYRLMLLHHAMRNEGKAAAMRAAVIAARPELAAPLEEQKAMLQLARSKQQGAKRVLLMAEFFHPSLGGLETFLECLGLGLQEHGYEVHVATKTLTERSRQEHAGMRIHQFPDYFKLSRGQPGGLDDLDFLIQNGGFSCVIILSHPDPWSMYVCSMAKPRPRIICLPILNEQNLLDFIRRGVLPQIIGYVKNADALCCITESASDMQILRCAGASPHFLPHMVPPPETEYRFREAHGIAPDLPLFAHVANFWPVKNHLGLIRQMRKLHGDWRMALIGSPHDATVFASVESAVEGDPRFLLLGKQPRDVALAAIREADLVLLGSHGEGCPMVILEAMSCGTPWLATPQCGSVRDQAGGVVAHLADFPLVILELMESPHVREDLGRFGLEHWRACFSKEAVIPAFIALVEQNGPVPDLRMSADLRISSRILWKNLSESIAAKHDVFLSNPFD